MGWLAMMVLALGMSMDAFAAALARGAAMRGAGLGRLLRTALVFGGVEMMMPLLGFALGSAASRWVGEWDHWLAFGLLAVLGGRMIYSGCSAADDAAAADAPLVRGGALMLAATALATSIDSLVAGVGLAFLDVPIWTAAVCIGLASTLMAALGLRLGQTFGSRFGAKAEIFGGVVLVAIGSSVLVDHMGWLA